MSRVGYRIITCKYVSKSVYIQRLKARVTRRRSLVLDKQKCFQLSSELAETVRRPQWSRQLVPKPRSGDIKRPVNQMSSGPRYDTCDGAIRAETGLGRPLERVWEIRQCTAHSMWCYLWNKCIRVDTISPHSLPCSEWLHKFHKRQTDKRTERRTLPSYEDPTFVGAVV